MEAARGQRRAARRRARGARVLLRRSRGHAAADAALRPAPGRCGRGGAAQAAARRARHRGGRPGSARSRASAGASASWDTHRPSATSNGCSCALDHACCDADRVPRPRTDGRADGPSSRRRRTRRRRLEPIAGEGRGLRAASRVCRRRRPTGPRWSSRCCPTRCVAEGGRVRHPASTKVDASWTRCSSTCQRSVSVRRSGSTRRSIAATLDAPVGGGVAQAASGELMVLAGGEPGVARACASGARGVRRRRALRRLGGRAGDEARVQRRARRDDVRGRRGDRVRRAARARHAARSSRCSDAAVPARWCTKKGPMVSPRTTRPRSRCR